MKVLWNERAPSNLANIDRWFVCGKGETSPLHYTYLCLLLLLNCYCKLHRQTEYGIFQVHSVFKRDKPDTLW